MEGIARRCWCALVNWRGDFDLMTTWPAILRGARLIGTGHDSTKSSFVCLCTICVSKYEIAF